MHLGIEEQPIEVERQPLRNAARSEKIAHNIAQVSVVASKISVATAAS